jgi:uncharacterized protein YndB with AHSA1/START domain
VLSARTFLTATLALVALFVLGLGALYLSQPTSYRIARSRTIAAPPSAVMAQLSDLRALEAWTPWAPEPGTVPTVTFSATTTGVGAWIDRRSPSGGTRTTITSASGDRIEMSNVTAGALGGGQSIQTFELRAVPGGTEVTWTLSSELHGLGRMLWPFVHLEARISPEMDAALTRLDQRAFGDSSP